MKAPYGWTVVRSLAEGRPFTVYRRDCPATAAHGAADLAQFTHPTKDEAVAAGRAGHYAYKR